MRPWHRLPTGAVLLSGCFYIYISHEHSQYFCIDVTDLCRQICVEGGSGVYVFISNSLRLCLSSFSTASTRTITCRFGLSIRYALLLWYLMSLFHHSSCRLTRHLLIYLDIQVSCLAHFLYRNVVHSFWEKSKCRVSL